MVTINDSFMCVVLSCEKSLSSYRLPYYIYIFQMSDLNLDFYFRFKVTYNGLKSNDLNKYINDLLSENKLVDGNGTLEASQDSIETVYNYILDAEDNDKIDYLLDYLDSLSDEDLKFLVFTAIMIKSVNKKYGIEGLCTYREYIENTIKQHMGYFDDVEFNSAVAILRKFGGGTIL